MPPSNNRILQFDVLRIVAAFAVVWLHSSAQRFEICYPSVEWDVRNVYDSLVRWCVPVFVMISGALFLDANKKIELKNMYGKYIARVAIVFIVWSLVYAMYDGIGAKGLAGFVRRVVLGPCHFWFLKMLIGLYVVVPVLRVIVADRKVERYFICLSLVTAFLMPLLFAFMEYISHATSAFAVRNYEGLGIKMGLGYVGYFVLGHYLSNNQISATVKRILCLIGILSFLAVVVLTSFVTSQTGTACLFFYNYMSAFSLLEAIAVFVVIKDIHIAQKYHAVLISASKLCLGIYIVHPLVIKVLSDYGSIDSSSLNPIYFVPLYALAVFIISYLVSFVLAHIPFIKRFLS